MIEAVAAISGLAGGILLHSFLFFSWPAIGLIALLGMLLGGAWFFTNRRFLAAASIFLITGAVGAARFHIADIAPPEGFLSELDSRISYEGVVVAEPDVRDATQRVVIRVSKDTESVEVLAIADRYPVLSYGDRVRVTGTLVLPEPFDTDAGRVFRYDKYLQKDSIRFLVEFSDAEILARQEGFSLYAMLYGLKRAFNDALADALPEPSASLAGGLILGGKQGLGSDLQQAFITAGLIHVVVLSGFNVMIVAEAVLRGLFFLPKRLAFVIAGAVIGLFVLMAGAGAASVRAGAMAGLGLFARATGRTFAALRALLFVGIAMVLWNPFVLAFDPGFQLSFVATAGLILGAPLVAARLAFIKSRFLREIVASTVAAQTAVVPLLLYQTGLFSAVALPANLLVLPVIPLAMGLSFAAGLISLCVPTLALIGGVPAYFVLSYISAAAETAAALPLSAFSLPSFPFALVVLAYTALAFLVWKLTMRGKSVLRTRSS